MKNKIVITLISIPFIALWLLCLFDFGTDAIFLINARKTTGVVTNIKYETHKLTCDYTEHPAGCGEYTDKYAYVNYKVNNKQYNSKLYLGSQGYTSNIYLNTREGDRISFYYNNVNKKDIRASKDGSYVDCIITIIVFLLPLIILFFVVRKKKVDKLEFKKNIDYEHLKIHKYDDNYAGSNKVNGVKPLTIATLIGIAIAPLAVIWTFLDLNMLIFIIIVILLIIVIVIYMKKFSKSAYASMSVIVEDGNDLYYLSIMPILQGANFPSTIMAAIAGRNAAFAENKIEAEITSSNLVKNDDVVIAWFKDYVDNKIKYDVMYGWPIKVAKFTKNDLIKESNKQKVYRCVWQDRKIGKVYIPKCFPTFWN